MSVAELLLCGVEGHDASTTLDGDAFRVYVPMYDAKQVQTAQDLATCFDLVHTETCTCGQKLELALWHANLAYGQDADAALAWYKSDDVRLLDGRARLDAVFPCGPLDVPPRTIHIMARTQQPLKPTSGPLTTGLRRLDGDLCRVAGSFERRLPDTSDFAQIVATSGCFYIDRFDWVVDYYEGTDPLQPSLRIPIVRRGEGFGKSTFLSAVASYFDVSFNPVFMPCLRTLTPNSPPQMLVFHLDFGLLRLSNDTSDDEVREECTRVMRHATQLFLKKYAAFFEVDVPLYSDEFPYGAVRAFALSRKRQIFLAIDNYTDPFLDMRIEAYYRDDNLVAFRRLEDAIYAHMLAHIFVDVATGLVNRGFITGLLQPGEELGRPVPFSDYAPIKVRTKDLTRSSIDSGIVGFTKSDVTELVRSFLGVEEAAVSGVVDAITAFAVASTAFVDASTGVDEEPYPALLAPRTVLEALKVYSKNSAGMASPPEDSPCAPAAPCAPGGSPTPPPTPPSSGTESGSDSDTELAALLVTPKDLSLPTFAPK